MRKTVAIIVVAIMIISFAGSACADENNGPMKKLGRGLANMLTCPLGLIQGIKDTNLESGPMAAFTWGVLVGTVNVVKRVAVGAYETVTFPIPVPEGYKPILTDPEFYFQSETDIFGDDD